MIATNLVFIAAATFIVHLVFCQVGESISAAGSGENVTCCACGMATYRLKFMGKWTRTRHPKHFPGRLAYFSSLIGASHSNEFVLWRIGQLASSGIRKMSEYGSQLELEQEIALKEAQLISKVVTKPVASCCESARATFKVNKYKPLFSAMSRVSPSPDWNVGVDSLDLCDHKKCSWRKKIELDLDPWDAGTDSGITFTSPNHESRPSEQIHYIGKRKDLHSESSLNLGGNKAPSLAKIILHLVKIDGKCSGHLNEVNIPKVGRAPGTCHVSIWTSWTRCSVSCGFGTRVRGRVILNSGSPQLCPPLKETIACNMGNCKKVGQRRSGNDCQVSKWGTWTKCSATCGKGIKVKTRNVIQMPGRGGKACPKLFRRKRCQLRPCRVPK
ncbi:spondin-1-like [Rhopilema esculentum]|uniref:spondin-1-like n=1 Tax=Rhopilema esculentum TaxID=499914 RepID=UPI0031E03CEE